MVRLNLPYTCLTGHMIRSLKLTSYSHVISTSPKRVMTCSKILFRIMSCASFEVQGRKEDLLIPGSQQG